MMQLWPAPVQAPRGAPNVLVILLDDVGFAASSTFGGPAQTPALDRLAAEGLRYNRFHVSAICSATRAALLSGRNDHRIGFGSTTGAAAGFPGYNTMWPKSAASIADVLRRSGYSTAAFGKWHNTPDWEVSPMGPFERWPTGLGFEYFYGIMRGMDSQWEPALYRNTTPAEPTCTPARSYHFTTDIVDQAINWLHSQAAVAPAKPHFLYFATAATHKPQHVPREWIEQYRGRFDRGWDQLRKETFERQKKLGVIPANARLTPRPPGMPAWQSLSAGQRQLLSRQMEVQAAYLAHTDHEIGRLLDAVRRGPHGDNTLILYVADDNGADMAGGMAGAEDAARLQRSLQRMDEIGSEHLISGVASGWAWAANTPFQWGKLVASHFGGTRVPLVVSWPAQIKDRGGLRSQFTHANDVAATVYEAVGIEVPSSVDGVQQLPLDGVSFADSFQQQDAPSRHRMQVFEQLGNRAIYKDGWVAAARHTVPWIRSTEDSTDYAADRWELYHVDEDFSQARDLAANHPQKLQELQQLFEAQARENNIFPFVSRRSVGKPRLAGSDSTTFTYYPGLPRMMSWSAPDFGLSHRITADIVVPEKGAEGVIVANGGRYGGFVLYAKDHRLVYENNFDGTREGRGALVSSSPLPAGKVQVVYEFDRDSARSARAISGDARLLINGQEAGSARWASITPQSVLEYFGTFAVGRAGASPVSVDEPMPFEFTGALEKVRIEMK